MGDIILKIIHRDTMKKGDILWGRILYYIIVMIKQQKHDELLIVQSNVYTDFLLDLTDLDVCNKMEQLWNKVYKENEIKIPKDKITLGAKLNYLYDYYDMFKDVYQVIKVIGKYKKTPQNSFYKYDLDSRRAEPTTAIKCIYNVKNVDAIATREKV